MPNELEILTKRRIIWEVISEFYLDTELQEDDLDRITQVFIQSGFELKELKEIDLYEVFPLLKGNLLAPAGAWAGFDQPWLSENCFQYYKKRKHMLHRFLCRFWNRFFYGMRSRYWKVIENRIS